MLAWRYGGEDPYRLFHMLDANYVPWGGGLPTPPQYPSRLRAFLYACGQVAWEVEAELHGIKVSTRGR